MKKLSILITVLAISTVSFGAAAQATGDRINAGTMMFGGSVFYQQRTITDDHDNSWSQKTVSFSPVMGYFLVSNIALLGKIKFEDTSDELWGDTSTFGLGFGAGFYIPKGVITFYMNGFFDFENTDYGNDNSQTTYGITLSAGVLFMLTKTWGLDAGIRFSYLLGTTETALGESDTSFQDFTVGYFGVQAFF